MATLANLAEWTGARFGASSPAHDRSGQFAPMEIDHVSAIDVADRQSCVFAMSTEALEEALRSEAGAILASEALDSGLGEARSEARVLWVADARFAFAEVAHRLKPAARIGSIAPNASVAADAVIGSRTVIGEGAVIEGGVRIGEDCRIGTRVVVHSGTTLGDRVAIQAGAVLGSNGFGYVRDRRTGRYLAFPQQGTLHIEEDVEIGANATVDRGALGETRIGRGTKIDNLVHIGHNCSIGEDVVIAAQAGIAGSSTVGDGAVLGGQVGIADHVTIGPGVVLGAQAGVPSGKRLEGSGKVFWGTPARPIEQYLRDLAKLRRL